MRDEMRYASAEVSAQDALDAAIERAARTQHALILAEAQVLWWKRRCAEVVGQLDRTDEDHWRPTAEGPAVFVCPHKGVEHGQEDGGESPAAVSEAGPEGPVPA